MSRFAPAIASVYPHRLLAILLAVAAAPPAHAISQAAAATPAIPLSGLVEQLLRSGRSDDATQLLAQLGKERPRDQQMRFLSGLVAIAKGDHKRAIRIFRAILIDHPTAMRVRLELARAFFLDGDYANADRQFRFARAGNPPGEVVANIDAYLYAIRQSKSWSYHATVSLAPDTNLNVGSSSREVTLYGLPFELSDDARRRSGVGFAVDLGGEWAPKIGDRSRLRIGLNAQRREYSDSDFDDMTLTAYAGPRFVSQRWDVSLLGTSFSRWYGAKAHSRSVGGRIEGTYYLTPELGLSGSLAAQRLDYQRSPEMSGSLISASLGMIRALTTASAATLKAGVNRQDARLSAYSNWSGYGAVGYFRDLPAGFSIYVEPSLSFARYDSALPIFGKPRSDRSISALVTLLNRHIVLSRFTPRIAYTFTKQVSNIPLYSFTRNRVEIGLTTNF